MNAFLLDVLLSRFNNNRLDDTQKHQVHVVENYTISINQIGIPMNSQAYKKSTFLLGHIRDSRRGDSLLNKTKCVPDRIYYCTKSFQTKMQR